MPNKSKFTVLLLTPDYLTSNFGQDVKIAHVTTAGKAAAVRRARHMVRPNRDVALEDFAVVAIFVGWPENLAP